MEWACAAKICMEYEVEGVRPIGRPKENLPRDCGKRLSSK